MSVYQAENGAWEKIGRVIAGCRVQGIMFVTFLTTKYTKRLGAD
jgi:hypothetical protein